MPSTLSLFAAIDASGDVRFVGDVPAGAACGRYCATCGSPLIARKGNLRIWHFAHEASQERPECLAGALNLLRRLTVSYLKSLPGLVLPRYERTVSRRIGHVVHAEKVGWDAQPIAVEWLDEHQHSGPVARMRLDNGLEALLDIHIAEHQAAAHPAVGLIGCVVFRFDLPADSDLRKELYVMQHLQRRGTLVWAYQPDVFGLVAAAQKRLQTKFFSSEREAQDRATRLNERFDQSWLLAQRAVSPKSEASASVPTPPNDRLPPWVSLRAKHRSFFGYRLKDGTAWVVFEMTDTRTAVACFAGESDWEEYLPPSVARFDPALGICVAASFSNAQAFFEDRRTGTRISTDFVDMQALA